MSVLKSFLWRDPANHMLTASLHTLMLHHMQHPNHTLCCCQTKMLHVLAQLHVKLSSAEHLSQSTVHAHAITCIVDVPDGSELQKNQSGC